MTSPQDRSTAMSETLINPPISPLRRRMIEDMTVRQFVEKTQGDYIRHVRTFTAFLGRSPDTATPMIFAASSCIRPRRALLPLHFPPPSGVGGKPRSLSLVHRAGAANLSRPRHRGPLPA